MNEKKYISDTGLEVAVIGMSARFPKVKDIKEYFDKLVKGEELIEILSEEELIEAGIPADLVYDKKYVRTKGIIPNIDCFDSSFFGYTPRIAEIMDPQIRVFHECAWEALEDGGYALDNKIKNVIGLCAAASLNIGWHKHIQENYGLQEAEQPYVNRDFLATLVAYKLNLTGPVFMINTACSSGLVAIHEACRAILTGEAKMMLAGAVSISTPQKKGYLYEEGMIMSKEGHLRPFDMESDGAVGGSGIGVVLLKDLKSAIKDKDHIYAIIKSTAINNDGITKVGFTAPSVEGQRKAIQKAMKLAQISPEDVVYLETHGTGTKLGDITELEALKQAFHTKKQKYGYCALGAVKANIGHLDVASGMAGFIKTVMILKKRILPPLVNYSSPNNEISFLDSPFYTPLKCINLQRSQKNLIAGVSSFGIGGTNAHAILQEYKDKRRRETKEKEEIILLSAKTEKALDKQSEDLALFLEQNNSVLLEDVSFTLKVGRKSFEHRKMIICKNILSLKSKLLKQNILDVYQENLEFTRSLQIVLDSQIKFTESCFFVFSRYAYFRDLYNECETVVKKLDISKNMDYFILEYCTIRFYEYLGIKFKNVWAKNKNYDLANCIYFGQSFEKYLQNFMQNGRNVEVEMRKKYDVDKREMLSVNLSSKLMDIKCDEDIHRILAYLWLNGENVFWDKLYGDTQASRIPMPTYPFERISYKKVYTGNKKSLNNLNIHHIARKMLYSERKLFEASNVNCIRNNKRIYNMANQLCASYICNFFQNSGVVLDEGYKYSLSAIEERTRVVPQYKKMIISFVNILEEENILYKDKEEYVVDKKVQFYINIDEIEKRFHKELPEYASVVNLLKYCYNNYKTILSGEKDALSILYPEGKSMLQRPEFQIDVEHSYCNIYIYTLIEGIVELLRNLSKSQTVRILEIGAGNGVLTKEILPAIKKYNVEYYFTDIGNSFIEKAKKEFESKYDFVHFKKFDISKDPKLQGILDNSFDIVVGLNVVHATKSIRNSLENIKKTLKEGGIIGLIESIHNERWYDMIDGLAEGWWYFEDEDLRKQPLISLDKWRESLKKSGFHNIYTYPASDYKQRETDMGLVIGEKVNINDQYIGVEKTIDEERVEYQRKGIKAAYVEPKTNIEKTLVEILSEQFGIEQIGIMDNFYEMGMDSIIAIQISSKLQKKGYQIKIEDVFKYPSIKEIENYIRERNTLQKKEKIEKINFISPKDQVYIQTLINENTDIEMVYPLTPMQRNVLAKNVLSNKQGKDVFTINLVLEGELKLHYFIDAWNLILKRHTILRTSFVWRKLQEPIQIVYKNLNMDIQYEDLSECEKEEQEFYISQHLISEKERGFKSSEAPLTRGYLIKIGEERHKFVWSFQHSLIDGWSINNIINDFLFIYSELNKIGRAEVTEIPFFNYIKWLSEKKESCVKEFWKKQFKDFQWKGTSNLEISYKMDYEMTEEKLILDKKEKESISLFSVSESLTVNTIFQMAWAIAMKIWLNQDDIILGFETSGRTSEVEEIVQMAGLFISVLPYRVKMNETITCSECMKMLMEQLIDMKNYEHVTLRDISQWSNIPISYLQQAVYERTIVYQNFPNELRENNEHLKIIIEEKKSELNINLRLYIVPTENFEVVAYYNKHKYQKENIEKLLQVFKYAVLQLIKDKDQKLLELCKKINDKEKRLL